MLAWSTYKNGIEVACSVTNNAQACRGRRLLKQPPEVVGLGVARDGGHWLCLHQSVIDDRGGQITGPLQEALLVCRAVVP